ncbi:hypothetical protein Taro_009256 [Colocasia esculenta]|uniref:Uncharacterized protein n=1 Tax=Colocasia esculenta TaxID=4460 RepID=A0A843TVV9_COLES|nr:hypothetical protein [Colocasia esculenta]
MLRGRCACQRLTMGRPENEGVAEAGLAKSCLGPSVDLPAGVAELSSRGTVPCGEILFKTCTKKQGSKIKKNNKSMYLSTARKVPVDRYKQASKTYFRTGVPVDSNSVAC